MNVLAIDDSNLIRTMLKNVLAGAGHTVTIACDGQEGAELAAHHKFDIVITDINMPEMNGLDLAKHLRKTDGYKTVPIIFLTTETSEDFKAKGKEITSTTWINKPFSPTKLLEAFAEAFKQKSVLAVDDSKAIRFMLTNVLTGAGYDVMVACDGKEAADIATKVKFDLIVTDVNMPEMDGIQLAKHLRGTKQYESTPIIFLTTETSEAFKAKGMEIGRALWVTKPFSSVVLLEEINKI